MSLLDPRGPSHRGAPGWPVRRSTAAGTSLAGPSAMCKQHAYSCAWACPIVHNAVEQQGQPVLAGRPLVGWAGRWSAGPAGRWPVDRRHCS